MKKTVSLRALDALNFCNAGIQTGLGPFIAIFYGAVRHWSTSQIGLLLALQSLAGVATQTYVGSVFDATKHKRLITAIAALTVSAGAILIGVSKTFGLQVVAQLVIGVGVTVFPAATASFALGLVGKDKIPERIARNEVFTHSGNVIFAILAGVVGTVLALGGILYAAAIFAAGMAGAVLFLKESEVDYEAARQGSGDGGSEKRRGLKDLFSDRNILVFTGAVVLFNVSNTATLPLVSQLFAARNGGHNSSSWQTAAAVLAAEIVMVGVAAVTGKKSKSWGRKPLFIAAFGLLAVRNVLGVVSHEPVYLIGLQAFDGTAAAIYGVLLKLVTTDLAKGSGRFNVLQGAVQSSMALGGFLSNLAFGWIAHRYSTNVSFVGLSVMALLGGAVYTFLMPETKDGQGHDEKHGDPVPAH